MCMHNHVCNHLCIYFVHNQMYYVRCLVMVYMHTMDWDLASREYWCHLLTGSWLLPVLHLHVHAFFNKKKRFKVWEANCIAVWYAHHACCGGTLWTYSGGHGGHVSGNREWVLAIFDCEQDMVITPPSMCWWQLRESSIPMAVRIHVHSVYNVAILWRHVDRCLLTLF